jgi:hypothetical protein
VRHCTTSSPPPGALPRHLASLAHPLSSDVHQQPSVAAQAQPDLEFAYQRWATVKDLLLLQLQVKLTQKLNASNWPACDVRLSQTLFARPKCVAKIVIRARDLVADMCDI